MPVSRLSSNWHVELVYTILALSAPKLMQVFRKQYLNCSNKFRQNILADEAKRDWRNERTAVNNIEKLQRAIQSAENEIRDADREMEEGGFDVSLNELTSEEREELWNIDRRKKQGE
jgi:hypothetical protein